MISAKFKFLVRYWRMWVVLGVPIVFLPLLFVETSAAHCGYMTLVVAIFWMTEALPLPITGLIPLVFLPLANIQSSREVAKNYMNDMMMMLLVIVAITLLIEDSCLNKRIALKALLMIGTEPNKLLLGFMLTAAVLCSLPIALSVCSTLIMIGRGIVEELETCEQPLLASEGENKEKEAVVTEYSSSLAEVTMGVKAMNTDPQPTEQLTINIPGKQRSGFCKSNLGNMQKALNLGILYGAILGQNSTLWGSYVNVVLYDQLRSMYGTSGSVNFLSWMLFGIPTNLVILMLSWLWLQYFHIGFRKANPEDERKGRQIRKIIETKHQEFGPMSYSEIQALIIFLSSVTLWLTQDLGSMGGWAKLFEPVKITIVTPTIIMFLLLFILPKSKDVFKKAKETEDNGSWETVMNWKTLNSHMPWGLFLFLGGAMALGDSAKVSGMAEWVGQQLAVFQSLPAPIIMLMLSMLIAMFTEVMNNLSTLVIALPIMAEIAKQMHVNPLYFMIPVALASSFAFALPSASLLNVFVYELSGMRTSDMAKSGIVMNLMAISVLFLSTITLGPFVFDLNTVPDWALTGNISAIIDM